MQKKTLFFAGIFVCLFVAALGYYQYQKPRTGTSGIAPVFSMAAEQLYSEYSKDEAAADKKYNNRVIEVRGVVKEVQPTERSISVLLDAGGAGGGVNCSFQSSEKNKATVGEHIAVKGRCTGFLMDVSLVDAERTDQ